VTETIPEIIAMIERLIASGNAYAAEGHVLFSVPSMPDYGKFSGRSIDEMLAGARVDVAPYKRSPMDLCVVEAVIARTAGVGEPVGSRAGRVGILSAQRWRSACWAIHSTFTAVARI